MSRAARSVLVLLVAAGVGWYALRPQPGELPRAVTASWTREDSGTMRHASGRVQRLLADDNDGSRHQRFIIETEAGTTLLVAHNIDLAPRLDGLTVGDTVQVNGEYEWNDKGGLIHWTHKDPAGDHPAGYVEWRGRRYQ